MRGFVDARGQDSLNWCGRVCPAFWSTNTLGQESQSRTPNPTWTSTHVSSYLTYMRRTRAMQLSAA